MHLRLKKKMNLRQRARAKIFCAQMPINTCSFLFFFIGDGTNARTPDWVIRKDESARPY